MSDTMRPGEEIETYLERTANEYRVQPHLSTRGGGGVTLHNVRQDDLARLCGAFLALFGVYPVISVQGVAFNQAGERVVMTGVLVALMLDGTGAFVRLLEPFHAASCASLVSYVKPENGVWKSATLEMPAREM